MNTNSGTRKRRLTWSIGPIFKVKNMRQKTADSPTWLHIGAGNLFRIYLGRLWQYMLDFGLTDTGLVVWEGFDPEIIEKSFIPFDNECLAALLHSDGYMEFVRISSIAYAFTDTNELYNIISKPTLQAASLTITEKGYKADNPVIEHLITGLYHRYKKGSPPISIVSLDNFSGNGQVLSDVCLTAAKNHNDEGFIHYLSLQSFPWTMIDKITPAPSEDISNELKKQGFKNMDIISTKKGTRTAGFVNGESSQYLVIEDNFPNGRVPLEEVENAGVFFTDRQTVLKADEMKVCCCLNPLHTILAICGKLLGMEKVYECMQHSGIVRLLQESAKEALPVVENPGIIDPNEFLQEVLTQRFTNPFIPDTTERIVTDTSQKIPVRFGVTLRKLGGKSKVIPLVIALWLRYMMGLDDTGKKIILAPDPKAPESVRVLEGQPLGNHINISKIVKDILGDICTDEFINSVQEYFNKLSSKINSVREIL